VTPQGFVLREMVPGLDFATLQARTGARIGRP
jgi:3-oxoadipate CoA-transferase beta subunit